MNASRLLLLVFLTAVAAPLQAQESGLAFLRIGTNAAAGAMGDSHVAHSRDAFSTYWNPAGLAAAEQNALALSYHRWVSNVQTYGVAARFRLTDRSGVGLFTTAMGSGELEARTRPGDPSGTFSVQFISAGAAYGRSLGPLRVGVTAKYLSERVYTNDANGYAFDFGVQTDLADRSLQLGAALQNVGEMTKLNAEASKLPRMLRVGAAVFPFRILTIDDDEALLSTMLTVEVMHLFPAETTQLHAGAGAQLFDVLDFRMGIITNDSLRKYTLGLGLHYEGFGFDYAFMPFQQEFEGPGHILTLNYTW